MLRHEVGVLAQPGARVLDLDDDGVVQQAAQEGGRNDGLADTSASGMRATLTSPADVKFRLLGGAGRERSEFFSGRLRSPTITANRARSSALTITQASCYELRFVASSSARSGLDVEERS